MINRFDSMLNFDVLNHASIEFDSDVCRDKLHQSECNSEQGERKTEHRANKFDRSRLEDTFTDRVELKGEEEEEHCDHQEDQTEHKKD